MPFAAMSQAARPARGSASPPWALSRQGLGSALLGLVAAGLLFGLFPQIDLGVAAWFYAGDNRFIGQTPLGEELRRLFYWAPFGLFAGLIGLYAARRMGLVRLWAPSTRGLLFLALGLAVGPGLLVNSVLKDHWHRPRPVQVVDFGGELAFRPFYRTDGGCRRNCSFVSGEGSAAFWCLAPALLVPLPLRAAAIAGALAFGCGVSLLRMAFGGHFLSDSVFAALLTWLVLIAAWRIVFGRGAAGL